MHRSGLLKDGNIDDEETRSLKRKRADGKTTKSADIVGRRNIRLSSIAGPSKGKKRESESGEKKLIDPFLACLQAGEGLTIEGYLAMVEQCTRCKLYFLPDALRHHIILSCNI